MTAKKKETAALHEAWDQKYEWLVEGLGVLAKTTNELLAQYSEHSGIPQEDLKFDYQRQIGGALIAVRWKDITAAINLGTTDLDKAIIEGQFDVEEFAKTYAPILSGALTKQLEARETQQAQPATMGDVGANVLRGLRQPIDELIDGIERNAPGVLITAERAQAESFRIVVVYRVQYPNQKSDDMENVCATARSLAAAIQKAIDEAPAPPLPPGEPQPV